MNFIYLHLELHVNIVLIFLFVSDMDDCESVPCQNGGSCMDHVDAFECICTEGFEGFDCEIGKNFILSCKK